MNEQRHIALAMRRRLRRHPRHHQGNEQPIELNEELPERIDLPPDGTRPDRDRVPVWEPLSIAKLLYWLPCSSGALFDLHVTHLCCWLQPALPLGYRAALIMLARQRGIFMRKGVKPRENFSYKHCYWVQCATCQRLLGWGLSIV